MSEFKQE